MEPFCDAISLLSRRMSSSCSSSSRTTASRSQRIFRPNSSLFCIFDRTSPKATTPHVFILDSLLIGGLRFVLDKVARVADAEMDDDAHLRESLLEGQTKLELGEMSEAEYAAFERDVLQRLSAARRRRQGGAESTADYKVTGADVDVQFTDDDDQG